MAIKNAVIEAIIEKWNLESRSPECEDCSEHAKLGNARNNGRREGIAHCADQLRTLVGLLSTDDICNDRVCDKVLYAHNQELTGARKRASKERNE